MVRRIHEFTYETNRGVGENMKKIKTHLVLRAILILITFVIQFGIYFWGVTSHGDFSIIFSFFLFFLSFSSALIILTKDMYSEYKLAWIIFFLLVPIAGGLVYLMYGRVSIPKRKLKLHQAIEKQIDEAVEKLHRKEVEQLIDDAAATRQSLYLKLRGKAPAFTNTTTKYYPLGEEMLKGMLVELEKAEKFIFMEYFIIEQGEMWNSIEEILIKKAKQGLDVRLMYDDLGCILTLPADFESRLNKLGVKVHVFSKFTHVFNTEFNHRDHRKICVIDGNVGFTGGVNLADEYINGIIKHGHWKDTAIKLEGAAVYSLTIMFLSMWTSCTGKSEVYENYAPTKTVVASGIVQPFSDSPFDDEPTGEICYMSILNTSRDYVYITTPYLIISREMMVSLISAAKSSVDVRIMLPYVPDKKYVHFLSRSYYASLIEAGVKIYEYTPGFVHSKMFVSDDKTAVIGTINLDYRSLCLHYECGVWTYKTPLVDEIKQDFLETLKFCHEVKLEETVAKKKLSWLMLAYLAVLRTLAPLM